MKYKDHWISPNHRCRLVCHFLQDYQVMWTKTKIWLEVQRKKSRIFDLRWWKRIFHCHEINKIFEFYNFLVETLTKIKPDAGLEPATVGLKVQRSTDWANQARCRLMTKNFIIFPVYRFILIKSQKKAVTKSYTPYYMALCILNRLKLLPDQS